MPALVAFGRRWKVGSDDFVLPGVIDVTVKFCWFVAAVAVYLKNDAHLECPSGHHMRIYIYGILTTLLLVILVDLVALQTTMTSYIMDVNARRFMAPCIYIRLCCEAVDISWNLLGTIWVYGGTLTCTEAPGALSFIKRFIVCNWFSLLILILFMLFLFDPLGGEDDGNQEQGGFSRQTYVEKHEAFWTKKWEMLCCHWRSGDKDTIKEGFEEIGKIFSTLLIDHDFVSTDVMAGFVGLYQREQENKLKLGNILTDHGGPHFQRMDNGVIRTEPKLDGRHYGAVLKEPGAAVQDENPRYEGKLGGCSVEEVVLANHYLNFVLGSYGWMGFVSSNYKNRALRKLWKEIQCCICCRSFSFEVVGDNCCFCHTAALKQTAKLSTNDLVYVSFTNKIYEPTFYVAIDHKTRSFVISIRGSMSLADIVADLTATPKNINVPGIPPNFKAYHGVSLCAMRIKDVLTEKKVLENLSSLHPDYNLVLIGVSLGAGTATVLGLMYLRLYPQLKVFAISPLGGLLSLEAAKFCERFTISIVYGDDMVPRLSLPSVEKLKHKIIRSILQSRTPKYQILLRSCACILCGSKPKIAFSKDDTNDDGPTYRATQRDIAKEHVRTHEKTGVLAYPMYLPGRILHITETQNWSDLQGGPRWRFRWADRTEFQEIIISPRMYKDHMHFRLQKALHEFVVAHRESVSIDLM